MRIKNLFYKFIALSTFGVFCYIFYYALTNINSEAAFFDDHTKNIFLLLLIGGAIIVSVICVIFYQIDRLSDRKIFLLIGIFTILFILGELIVCVNFQVTPKTDSYVICDEAMSIAKGSIRYIGEGLDIDYFKVYTNNNFLVIIMSFFFRLLLKFNVGNIPLALNLFNMIILDIGVLLSCLLVKEIGSFRAVCKLLVLFTLCPVFYFTIVWSYSLLYSIPFQIGIIYTAILIYKQKTLISASLLTLILGVLTVVGFELRPTTFIAFIAVAICALLNKFTVKKIEKKDIIVCVVLVLSLITLFTACNRLLESYLAPGQNIKNYPITHWILTGLQGDGKVSSQINAIARSYDTTEQMQAANIAEIKNILSEYGVSGILHHFGEKIQVTWTDGSFGYYWRMFPNNTYSPLFKYVVGEKIDFVIYYCQIFYVAILFYAVVGLGNKIKKTSEKYFAVPLTVFGGILFYLIWESKVSFSLPFIPLVFMMAIGGSDCVKKKVCEWGENRRISKRIQSLSVIVILLTCFTMISQYNTFTKTSITRYERSVQCTNDAYIDYTDNASSIKQEFYTNIPFNTIELYVKNNLENEEQGDVYRITLMQGDEKYLTEYVTADDYLNNEKITLNFKKVVPNGYSKYTLSIDKLGEADNISWKFMKAESIDNYKGDFYIDNEQQSTDLYMQVYNTYKSTYSTSLKYVFCCVLVLGIEFLVLAFVKQMRSGNLTTK